ncbi:uncharacterized protein FA14DRAFT_156558 [Meira miltonrushii]|uniref:Uncharacterized protein n=1 Tax=Meira miltonrushii TaxID=1280837 RepID=A0A316VD00_9BASI|nr:uncharacterized protein FA14DRAFT_156558 [Meira miltonrushii]PWN33881.1 hypothetical protein FA14DRAFT_156558 [Meira miltonrushii]
MTSQQPSTASRAAPPPPPSHAHFILAQIRSGLAHLRATQALKKSTCDKINDLLSQDELQEGESTRSIASTETEEEKLGKRNAWLRETLMETSLLPTLVDTAMQIAIPQAIMGDMQREAVVQLVERSQRSIAQTVTDPKMQRKTGSGAWSGVRGTHTGIRRGWNAAGNSIQEIAQKRQEAKEKSEEKRAAKNERKAMKKELKQEREAIVKQRQSDMLSGEEASNDNAKHDDPSQRGIDRMTSAANLVHSPSTLTAASDTSSFSRRLPPLSIKSAQSGKGKMTGANNVDDSDEDESEEEDAFDAEDGAIASVSCGRIDDEENCVTATTFFSPWPGLLLSNTLVAVSSEALPASIDIDRVRYDQSVEQERKQSSASLPPQRRVAPAPSVSQQPAPSRQGNDDKTQSSTYKDPAQYSDSQRIQRSNDVPPIPPKEPSQQAPAPPPLLPTQTPSYHPANPSPVPVRQNPPPAPASQTTLPQQPQQNEVRDVTESKQKSWTRKLGL